MKQLDRPHKRAISTGSIALLGSIILAGCSSTHFDAPKEIVQVPAAGPVREATPAGPDYLSTAEADIYVGERSDLPSYQGETRSVMNAPNPAQRASMTSQAPSLAAPIAPQAATFEPPTAPPTAAPMTSSGAVYTNDTYQGERYIRTGEYTTEDGSPYPGAATGGGGQSAYAPVDPSSSDGLPSGYAVHLASYRVTAGAQRGWEIISNDLSDILGAAQPITKGVEIPGKGYFVRLMAGPYDNHGAASATCAQIKNRGEYCVVMRVGS